MQSASREMYGKPGIFLIINLNIYILQDRLHMPAKSGAADVLVLY